MKMNFFKKVLCIPKSLYFNLYYFSFRRAIKLPVLVAHDVKLLNMGNRDGVKINDSAGKIHIGFGESFALGGRTGWDLSDGGKVVFKGPATFGRGTQIICRGSITFGENFYCNANCVINAGKSIKFGENVLLGWNCTVLDGDGHKLIDKNGESFKYDSVDIGNHVWCAFESKILKGSFVPDNSVVAAGACITKKFDKHALLLGGFNRVLRTEIEWNRTF